VIRHEASLTRTKVIPTYTYTVSAVYGIRLTSILLNGPPANVTKATFPMTMDVHINENIRKKHKARYSAG
jgi:hypothetical protein